MYNVVYVSRYMAGDDGLHGTAALTAQGLGWKSSPSPSASAWPCLIFVKAAQAVQEMLDLYASDSSPAFPP